MAPVGYHTQQGSRRVRFTSNVCYDGRDYGPDYDEAEINMPPHEAFRFVNEGRAEYVDDGPTEAVIDESLAAPVQSKPKSGGRK